MDFKWILFFYSAHVIICLPAMVATDVKTMFCFERFCIQFEYVNLVFLRLLIKKLCLLWNISALARFLISSLNFFYFVKFIFRAVLFTILYIILNLFLCYVNQTCHHLLQQLEIMGHLSGDSHGDIVFF